MFEYRTTYLVAFMLSMFICGIAMSPTREGGIDDDEETTAMLKSVLANMNHRSEEADNDGGLTASSSEVGDEDYSSVFNELPDDMVIPEKRGKNLLRKKSLPRRIFIGKRDYTATEQGFGKKRAGQIHRIFIGKRGGAGDIKRIFIG